MDGRTSFLRRFINTAYVAALGFPGASHSILANRAYRASSATSSPFDNSACLRHRPVLSPSHGGASLAPGGLQKRDRPERPTTFRRLLRVVQPRTIHVITILAPTHVDMSIRVELIQKFRSQFIGTAINALRRLAYNERDRAVLNKLLGQGWGQNQLFLLPDVSVSLIMRKFWDCQTLTHRGLARRSFFSPRKTF